MQKFDVADGKRVTQRVTLDQARELGYSDAQIAAGMRDAATTQMRAAVDGYRHKLSGHPGPERVGIWTAKARIARENIAAAAKTPEPFKSHLTREAEAVGLKLADLMAKIIARADAFESVGMMIDALEAEAGAGLSAVSDAEGLVGGFEAYLAAAQEQADKAFAETYAQMKGGA